MAKKKKKKRMLDHEIEIFRATLSRAFREDLCASLYERFERFWFAP